MDFKITEKRNLNSMDIDRLSTNEILRIINREDVGVAKAVQAEIPSITNAVEIIASRMRRGGRLIYVGAGTSGRLGVLDAVECVPTFSTSPELVIGLLAGGKKAMFLAQEDIEDKFESGVKEIKKYKINKLDSVVGIAASGETPFVLGAICHAKDVGAATIGLACNKNTQLEQKVEVMITPIVGPEVITGSTRMKAGTAQKMVLNMISTTSMIKLGKVYSNLMVDLKASNNKLRERAKGIFMTVTGESIEVAAHYLSKSHFAVKEALVMFYNGVDFEKASQMLDKNGGLLRQVIQNDVV